jgi:hypothetical protein
MYEILDPPTGDRSSSHGSFNLEALRQEATKNMPSFTRQ